MPAIDRHAIGPAMADERHIGASARMWSPLMTTHCRGSASALSPASLVAFPTETVYGLGGDATSDRAVARIFEATEAPRFNPLIVHFPDADPPALGGLSSERARRLWPTRFWPGALTLVPPRRPDCAVSLLASAGLDSLAVRVPRHTVAQALLVACGRPIAAPSANASGKISPTTAEHVARSLGAKRGDDPRRRPLSDRHRVDGARL